MEPDYGRVIGETAVEWRPGSFIGQFIGSPTDEATDDNLCRSRMIEEVTDGHTDDSGQNVSARFHRSVHR